MTISLYSGPLKPVDAQFVDQARVFAAEHLKPHAEHWELTKQQPEKTLRLAISQFAGFVIESDMPGVSAKPAYNMFGNHAMGVNELEFSNCTVDAGSMVFAPGAVDED